MVLPYPNRYSGSCFTLSVPPLCTTNRLFGHLCIVHIPVHHMYNHYGNNLFWAFLPAIEQKFQDIVQNLTCNNHELYIIFLLQLIHAAGLYEREATIPRFLFTFTSIISSSNCSPSYGLAVICTKIGFI
jgi:hypothetical protein